MRKIFVKCCEEYVVESHVAKCNNDGCNVYACESHKDEMIILELDGSVYRFCSEECLDEFIQNRKEELEKETVEIYEAVRELKYRFIDIKNIKAARKLEGQGYEVEYEEIVLEYLNPSFTGCVDTIYEAMQKVELAIKDGEELKVFYDRVYSKNNEFNKTISEEMVLDFK